MKRFLEVIKKFYTNNPLQMGLMIINLFGPILVLIICIVEQYFILRFFLLSFVPFLTSVIFLIFRVMFIKNRVISFLIDFITCLLIIPFFILHIMIVFGYTLSYVTNELPTNDIGEYEKLRVNEKYFPKKISKSVSDVKMYYNMGMFQAGTYMILYYKTDNEELEYYKNKYEDWKETVSDEAVKILGDRIYYDTPYEDGLSDDFIKYQIYAICDDSGYCNHGRDKHYAINYETNEIIFYYASW